MLPSVCVLYSTQRADIASGQATKQFYFKIMNYDLLEKLLNHKELKMKKTLCSSVVDPDP